MGPDTRVRLLWGGVVLLALEGLGLAAIGCWLGLRSLGGGVQDREGAIVGALVAILGGVLLLGLASAMAQRKRWARSPVIVLQVLCLPVGWGLIQSHRPEIGVPLILVPLAAIIALAAAGSLTPE